ncbi:transposase, partial [bacterium]|nr:transposase [bacterium]
ESLRRGIGEAHRRYSRRVNFREGWRGLLWQGRFASFPMDEAHLHLATRYIEWNPVRARVCRAPWRYRWSSAAAHVVGRDDGLVKVAPLLKAFGDWREFLRSGLTDEEMETLRRHERSGRPLGSERFVARIEKRVGRVLHPGKRGPKGPRKHKGDN